MAITAVIEDGQLVSTGATNSSSTSSSSSTGTTEVNEDMFLQLLVAEMKYQDPMEPTSNTEWVSQYATFSQVEKMTSMQQSISQLQGSNLVGKQVIMKTTSSSGETTYFSGQVDYMYVENGSTFLSINGTEYPIEDLDSVVDSDYMDAITSKTDFENMMDKMPTTSTLTLSDESLITSAREAYDAMTDYQKTFIDSDLVDTLEELEEKLASLKQAAGVDTDTTTDTDDTEEGTDDDE